MALTNAQKQEAHRERQRQMAGDQMQTIAAQQKMISELQAQVNTLTAENTKHIADKHALEIKLLKLQAKK